MKILILLKKYQGGVGVVVKNVSQELKENGHSVDIVSREDDMHINSLFSSLFQIRKKVNELMKEKKYDIIYTQDWSLAFPLLFPYKIFSNKHFCCFHGEDNSKLSLFLQWLTAKMLKNNLIVVGDNLKNKFSASNKIYNGIDLKKFKPLKIKKIKNGVGFANWKTDEYHFNEIRKICLKLDKKLIIAENINQDKMPEFFNKLEMFVSLPPKNTGFGLVWLEAMACGVPKIIGNNYGIGKKLSIDKIENFKNLEDAIKKARKKKYVSDVKKEFDLSKNVKKLLKVWSQNEN